MERSFARASSYFDGKFWFYDFIFPISTKNNNLMVVEGLVASAAVRLIRVLFRAGMQLNLYKAFMF